MRALEKFLKAARMVVNRRTAEPDLLRTTTKRKKYTGLGPTYNDVMNLPAPGGSQPLQDPSTGVLVHLMDYDPWP